MNIVIPEQALLKLDLLRQADKLSAALCEFMVRNLPTLPDLEDSELVFFTERYAISMAKLKDISDRVSELNSDDNITPETEPQCESLRLSTKANLAAIAEHYAECKQIVEERKTRYQQELIEARKKRNLCAYLQSSVVSHIGHSIDTHK